MIISIHQPNYLPWLGFYYKMAKSDVFIILTQAQHSKSSFTHRNRVKTRDGARWLTIPLINKETIISGLLPDYSQKWQQKHWNAIEQAYSKAPYWNEYSRYLKDLYELPPFKMVKFNMDIILLLRVILDIKTKIIYDTSLNIGDISGNQRNLEICKALGADTYLSGTGAESYNDADAFQREGIDLVYSGFAHPTYSQLWGEFIPNMSVIDLLFNEGEGSREILMGGNNKLE